MTKKDYELIARAIKGTLPASVDRHTVLCVVNDLAIELRKDNPKFDRAIFMKACGFDPAERPFA